MPTLLKYEKGVTIKSVYFPIIFPDGIAGALTITKINPDEEKEKWQPSNDIQKIMINWE